MTVYYAALYNSAGAELVNADYTRQPVELDANGQSTADVVAINAFVDPSVLIVENGTGLSDATSYISVADAALVTGVTLTAPELTTATLYLDQRYGGRAGGCPLVTTQALEFPRYGLRDRYGRIIEGLPGAVPRATALMALSVRAGTVFPATTADNVLLKRSSVTAGPVSESLEFNTDHAPPAYLPMPEIDALMLNFCDNVTRAVR